MSIHRTKRHASRRVFFAPKTTRTQGWLLLVLALLVYGNIFRLNYLLHIPTVQASPQVLSVQDTELTTSNAPAPDQTTAATQPAVSTGAKTAVSGTVISTPKSCTGSRYTLPSQLDTLSASDGLTKVIDTPTYYQVYGASLPELRSAVQNCPLRAASGDFHALTAFQLNWSYSTGVRDGACVATNVRVALHVNQYYPLFVPTSSTPASVSAAWNTYMSHLRTHEDGHVAIDVDYAQRLTTALQSVATTDCSNLSNQVQTTIHSYVSLMNGANDLYDSRTNHGATQGAIL